MSDNNILERLLSVGQQVVNSGADQEKVKSFIKELTPLNQINIEDIKKQEIISNTHLPKVADEKVKAELPTADAFSWWEEALINTALSTVAPGYVALINISRGISVASGVTIGLGPQGTAGILVGLGATCGLCTYPNGALGYYGGFSGVVGAIASISLTFQCTIIDGGKEDFSGWVWGVGISGGEEVVGNAAALLRVTDNKFVGITAGLGIGAGIPIEEFVTAQRTWAK